MLLMANMDPNMSSEGIKTAAYVRNRSPHSATSGNQTPNSIFKKQIPSVKHYKVFGSPSHQHKKFGDKSIKGQFVGYELAYRSYRVYYAETNQVRVHRDVDFNETALFPSMKQQHSLTLSELESLNTLITLLNSLPDPL
jgi:hypothetical protein